MTLDPYITTIKGLGYRLGPLRKRPNRFLITTVLVLLTLALTWLVQWALGSGASILFAAIVAGSTAFFGLASGLCAAAFSSLLLNYFFIDPLFQVVWNTRALRCAIGMVGLVVVTHVVERYISGRLRAQPKGPPPGRHGFLDGVEDGVVSGWAFDTDHLLDPVTVSIFVNKSRVAEVAAVHHRPDLPEVMRCSGSHGFYVDIRDQMPNAAEIRVDACFSNGEPLANTPIIFANSCIKEPPFKTILFMHIPKTAGTAFREAIAANFRLSEIAYIYPTPPGFLVSDLRALSWRQLRSYRIVIGHYQYGMHAALPQASEYITMVREPTARVISQYAYIAETQRELVTDKSGNLMPLGEIFEKHLTVDFDNAIVRCFSGVDQTVFPPGTLTKEIYDRAVHNLQTAFTFVGHQEESEDGYAWLCEHFDWHAVPKLSQVNRRTTRKPENADHTAMVDAIRHHNRWDLQFYEEICRRFPRE